MLMNPLVMDRRIDKDQSIDARFVDMWTGLHVDIVAVVSVTFQSANDGPQDGFDVRDFFLILFLVWG
jgi:hypothetical protein